MIHFDVTKTGKAGHRSGLTRVSQRLRDALGASATEITWPWSAATNVRPEDWILTGELFSEDERPGLTKLLDARPCRLAAIFHDAIPLKHPHITWPQSVARHPGYMKLLARFDRVFAVSRASRDELLGFWRWQGLTQVPLVEVLPLGANIDDQPRATTVSDAANPPQLLCLGILEPRKNQAFLLEVCHDLWTQGSTFELHLVGRVNPHFGAPIVSRIKVLQRTHRDRLHFHEAASDDVVASLYASASATVFPTIAEGCGLPLLESLWRGVPCICSDLPVLRENADGGGCLPVAVNDRAAWTAELRRIVTNSNLRKTLAEQAISRSLPTWREAAHLLTTALGQTTSSSPA